MKTRFQKGIALFLLLALLGALCACGHTHAGRWETVRFPDCTGEGEEQFRCSCGELLDTRPIAPSGHWVPAWTRTGGSCGEGWEESGTCSVCGAAVTRSLPATEHVLGEETVKKAPGCETPGTAASVCEVCGEVFETVLPPAGHPPGEWTVVTAPTCDAEGRKRAVCEVCGKTWETVLPPTGIHEYGNWITVTAPTAEESGAERRVCRHCGAAETRTVPPVENDEAYVRLAAAAGEAIGERWDYEHYAIPKARFRCTPDTVPEHLRVGDTFETDPLHRYAVTAVDPETGIAALAGTEELSFAPWERGAHYAYRGRIIQSVNDLGLCDCCGIFYRAEQLRESGYWVSACDLVCTRCGARGSFVFDESLCTGGRVTVLMTDGNRDQTDPEVFSLVRYEGGGLCFRRSAAYKEQNWS